MRVDTPHTNPTAVCFALFVRNDESTAPEARLLQEISSRPMHPEGQEYNGEVKTCWQPLLFSETFRNYLKLFDFFLNI